MIATPAESLKEFHDDPFRSRNRIVLFFALLGLCGFLRLWDLGNKTMMHDELLFTMYTYNNLYQKFNYEYSAILHGPLMLHIQNLVFHIFGASDYTVRLGVALLGIGSFLWVWKLRFWLGEAGTWFALLFFAVSPGIGFFNRFLHMDGLFLFNTLWIVASLANWWRTRDPRWAASAIIAIAALFNNKASAVFVYFSVFTYILLVFIHDTVAFFMEGKAQKVRTFLEPIPRSPRVAWLVLIPATFVILVLTQTFEGLKYDSDVVENIGHDWTLRDVRSIPVLLGWATVDPVKSPDAGPAGTRAFWGLFYSGLFIALLAVGWIAKLAVDHRAGRTEFLAKLWADLHRGRWYVLGALLFSVAFYVATYTTFMFKRIGFFEIYSQTWSYWGGQHEWGRIGGPFHQHPLNLLIYETPAVLIISAVWFASLFRVRWTRTTGVAFLLMAVAAAVFHKLIFSGAETLLPGTTTPVPMNFDYLKHLALIGGFLGVVTLLFPRSGRVILPVSLVSLLVYSIAVFSSARWAALFAAPIFNYGERLRTPKAEHTLASYIEMTFNFDGGWNIAFVMILIFFATIYAWNAIDRGERFHGFLVWWTVTMVGSASYAREGVPQVGIHAMLPAILLSASYFDRFYNRLPAIGMRRAAVACVCILALWNLKAFVNMNFRQADDPRERMAYGPSFRDVKEHMKFVERYVRIAPLRMDGGQLSYIKNYNDIGRHKDVKIFMKPLDQVTWPAKWYFRNIAYQEGGDVQKAIDDNFEFFFLSVEEAEKFPALKERYHFHRSRGTTFWTPDVISPMSLLNIWKEWIPGHYLDATPQASEAFNAKEDWKRVWRYLILRETFEGTGRVHPSVSSFDYVFCFRKDLF